MPAFKELSPLLTCLSGDTLSCTLPSALVLCRETVRCSDEPCLGHPCQFLENLGSAHGVRGTIHRV